MGDVFLCMRGEDLQQHELFSYGSLEERVPKGSSVASHPIDGGRGVEGSEPPFRGDLRGRWTQVDSAGAITPRFAVADVVLDAKRADADGADGIQPVVPLVRGSLSQRAGV